VTRRCVIRRWASAKAWRAAIRKYLAPMRWPVRKCTGLFKDHRPNTLAAGGGRCGQVAAKKRTAKLYGRLPYDWRICARFAREPPV
jgi:hypothetical protein